MRTALKCEGCGEEVVSLLLANWGNGQKCMVCKTCLDTKAWGDEPIPKPVSAHYTKLAIDPYEYAHRNGLGMLQGNVVKYITRYKDKGGREDLEKAMNTLKRLIEMEYPG